MMRRLVVLGACLALTLGVTAAAGGVSSASSRAKSPTSTSPSSSGIVPFKQTETINREFLVNGQEQVVDQRTVTLKVSQTANLRGRQEIVVSWTGAHPTGGIVSDENSIDAQEEEYPFVLLECRGVDSTTVAAADQISPETCWTQNWSEHYQDSFQTEFPPYRLDQFAPTADRAQVVGAPSPLPAACNYLPAPTQHWVPFVAATGEVYYGGPAGCAGQPAEAQDVDNESGFPSNETFGVTGLDGKGSADFDVWTSAETHPSGAHRPSRPRSWPCPIMGISCDATFCRCRPPINPPAPRRQCGVRSANQTGAFAPGQLVNPAGNDDLSVSGSLWWSPSNWRNRITVPLSFAVPASACDVVSSRAASSSTVRSSWCRATGQWAPHFCLNPKLFSFIHVQTGSPKPATCSRPTVQRPPSPVTPSRGLQQTGRRRARGAQRICHLLRDRRGQRPALYRAQAHSALLAKLLTESYPAELPVQEEDPALAHNPLNITLDPEFIGLNPGITTGRGRERDGLRARRAFQRLRCDRRRSPPTSTTTPRRGPGSTESRTRGAWSSTRLQGHQTARRPVASLVAVRACRLLRLGQQRLSVQQPGALPAAGGRSLGEPRGHKRVAPVRQSQTRPPSARRSTVPPLGEKLVALGPQTVGYRFMIGITPIADDYRYQFRAAALQTTRATSSPRRTLLSGGGSPAEARRQKRDLADPLSRTQPELSRLPRHDGRLRGYTDIRPSCDRRGGLRHPAPVRRDDGETPGSAWASSLPAICP